MRLPRIADLLAPCLALWVGCLGVAAQPAFLTNGLVAHYRFDGNAYDASGNRSHGQSDNLMFGPDRFGASDRALLLAAESVHAPKPIPVAGLPIGNSPRTFSVWFKSEGGFPDEGAGVGGACLFAYGSRSPRHVFGEWLFKLNGQKPNWGGLELGEAVVNGKTASKWKTGTAHFTNGRWQQLTITYDGANKLLFYLDGTKLDWGEGAFRPPLNTVGTALTIGKTYWGQNPYVGLLDDLRIYRRALSPDEVKQLHDHDAEAPGATRPR